MRTTIHHQDGPIRSAVSDHSDFCVLSFQQGGDIVHIHLPKRMEAASHMIVEAFNAHMNPEPRVIAVQTGDPVDAVPVGFPSGGALSAESALAITASWLDGLPTGKGREGDGDHAIVVAPTRITVIDTMQADDDHAAHAVERRDLP